LGRVQEIRAVLFYRVSFDASQPINPKQKGPEARFSREAQIIVPERHHFVHCSTKPQGVLDDVGFWNTSFSHQLFVDVEKTACPKQAIQIVSAFEGRVPIPAKSTQDAFYSKTAAAHREGIAFSGMVDAARLAHPLGASAKILFGSKLHGLSRHTRGADQLNLVDSAVANKNRRARLASLLGERVA
jgi:hypothetical protein